MNERAHILLAVGLIAGMSACLAGNAVAPGTSTRNGSTTSEFIARPWSGGSNEGPLGFTAPVSQSHLYQELADQGIHPETMGPLNEIKDPKTLLTVMQTFTQALGVRCSWCHETSDWAAPTPRKAVAAFMWDSFVAQMQLVDGSPVYCDSCHHQSTVFLHRNPSERISLLGYMKDEYVDHLRRRDGKQHGCGSCHGNPANLRFLPRMSNPEGYHAPTANPGPQP